MKNSVEDNGAEKAIELGLDDLEAITGGTFEEQQAKIAILSTVADMACLYMKAAYARNERSAAEGFDAIALWALNERRKVIAST